MNNHELQKMWNKILLNSVYPKGPTPNTFKLYSLEDTTKVTQTGKVLLQKIL